MQYKRSFAATLYSYNGTSVGRSSWVLAIEGKVQNSSILLKISLFPKCALISYKNEASIKCLSFSGGRRLRKLDEDLNYRSPSEHHPFMGIAIHKAVRRSNLNEPFSTNQLNFTHGVASRDPYPNSVILVYKCSDSWTVTNGYSGQDALQCMMMTTAIVSHTSQSQFLALLRPSTTRPSSMWKFLPPRLCRLPRCNRQCNEACGSLGNSVHFVWHWLYFVCWNRLTRYTHLTEF